MRISKLFIGILLLAVFTCSSCNKAAQSLPTQTDEQTPVVTKETQGVRYSRTTGRAIDAPVVYKPVGIMIGNSGEARPQTGLQAADVVYEAPVEGSITRLFCIFNDTLPEVVGPVRSARVYYMRIQQEWDCAYAHFGGAEVGEADINAAEVSAHIKTRINFITGKYNNYYWRSKDRGAPHNAYTNIKKLQTLIQQEAQGRTFLFDENATYEGNTVTEITIPFNGSKAVYKYDKTKNLLVRFAGNKEFKDAATGSAVSVQNLIVQYAHFYHNNLPSGLWLCDLLGSGKAEYFIDGKHVTGTWERKSYDLPTVFRDANGKEIVLRPGNTWIAVHPDNVKISFK